MNGNDPQTFPELKVNVPDQLIENETNTKLSKYNVNDLLKIIHLQQSTINQLTKELNKNAKNVSRDDYEKTLNELETEKYNHAKTKLELIQSKDAINAKIKEIEFFKNELDKERCAYANVYQFLKNKLLNESTKGIDLISKIAEAEIRYNDVIEGLHKKESKYTQLEKNFELKIEELNLKVEQEKYINNLIHDKPSKHQKSKKKI